MIIYPDNTIEKQSHRPNENWTDDETVIVVDDNTELSSKIIEHTPYFERVLDEIGNLIDITPTERPPEPPKQPSDIELIAQGVSEREIQEIIQGQQISDLEIRLITGGL